MNWLTNGVGKTFSPGRPIRTPSTRTILGGWAGECCTSWSRFGAIPLPKFEIYLEDTYVGCIRKEFTFLRPRFTLDCNGWYVEGRFLEWDYRILDGSGRLVATITKEILHWTDTYVIDVERPEDALLSLMVVLAIDAEKCSRD